MVVAAVSTVDRGSVRLAILRRMPVPETAVLVVTIAVVLLTGDLALGVGVAVVHLTRAQVWHASTVAVLDAIEQRYADHGRRVRFEGLDARSAALHARLPGRFAADRTDQFSPRPVVQD